MQWTAISWVVAALLLSGTEVARSITCDECQELDKNKVVTQQQLNQKEKELESWFKKKAFQKVTEVRNEITDLRKKMMEFDDKQKNCRDACKPEVIKEAECRKLRNEINTLESAPSEENSTTEKVDALYRDLRRCNKELEELTKERK